MWDLWELDFRETLPLNEGHSICQNIHVWCCEPYKDSGNFHFEVCLHQSSDSEWLIPFGIIMAIITWDLGNILSIL